MSAAERLSEVWLAPEDVEELTAKKRWTAQCRKLADMGVPFTPNAVGRPLIERAYICKTPAKPKVKRGPNWGAIGKP